MADSITTHINRIRRKCRCEEKLLGILYKLYAVKLYSTLFLIGGIYIQA